MWSDFFEAGGWGMYPTAFFGFVFVASGVLYLIRPESRFAPMVLCAGIAAMGAGLLGSSVGIVNTLRYARTIAPDEQLKVAFLGCAESLNNLVLALMVTMIAALLTLGGVVRAARMPQASRA